MRRRLNRIALAAVVASLAALAGAGGASATILEVGGNAKKEKVEITASLNSNSITLARTDGITVNICTESHLAGSTSSPYAGQTVTAPLSSLSFSSCTRSVTVHKAGTLHVEHIPGTTNGTVTSSGAEVTMGSPLGTLNCKTNAGVDIGTLTGVKEGHATIDINAVLDCGLQMPSASWKGTYTITNPTGLGVEEADPVVTRLEVGGVTKEESVEITASLEPGTSSLLKGEVEDTFFEETEQFANTCTNSQIRAATASPFSGANVSAPISELSFSGCTIESPVVHQPGQLHIKNIPGTTNGTVSSSGAEVTVGSPFGTLKCITGGGAHLGTLTGKAGGNAEMHVNAVLNCGFFAPSASWKGTYVVTAPSGLGVSGPTTVLEVGGATKSESVEITASLKPGTSALLQRTTGEVASTCISSHVKAATTGPFSGTEVTGPISELSFSGCTPRYPEVDKTGNLSIEWSSGTGGTVTSSDMEMTVLSRGGVLNCKLSAGSDLGTLTGKKEGNATLDINAPLDCGPHASNASWEATYTVTSPTGLGVTDEPPPLATTSLEVGGAPKDEAVAITASLKSGSSSLLARTDGSFANTCTESHAGAGTESPYHGAGLTGPLSSLSFAGCTRPVTVHKPGKLIIEHIPGTTDGTVFSEEAEVTTGSIFGTLNCKTGEGAHLGTLTGGKEGHATLDVDAVLNCGFLVPSAKWAGTYTVTSPTGLGVTE